jgi:hypothetical protein
MANGDTPGALGPGFGRLVEWAVLAAVLLALCAVAWREGQQLQAQAELVTFRATVRALKQALLLRQLQAARAAVPGAVGNPFELLDVKPANYVGALGLGDALAHKPGIWVYDAVCGCAAYLPRQAQWLASASGSAFVVLQVDGQGSQARLLPREAYFWGGQPML